MALDGLRKVVTIVEDVEREGGEPVDPPTRMVAAGAVLANPLAGRYVEDLEPLIERYCDDHTVRSHHQTFEVRIPDSPRADELVIWVVVSSGGRPHARLGAFGSELS